MASDDMMDGVPSNPEAACDFSRANRLAKPADLSDVICVQCCGTFVQPTVPHVLGMSSPAQVIWVYAPQMAVAA